ncbi:MAG: FHA domain-containing protein [Gammaproteobacteria bacterium]
MAILLHVRNGTITAEYALQPGTLRIGRNLDNDVRLDDSTVSGHHAVVTIQPSPYMDGLNDVFVDDLGSTNGTLINGEPVTHQRLHHEDILKTGTHEFRFVAETEALGGSTRILLSDPDD